MIWLWDRENKLQRENTIFYFGAALSAVFFSSGPDIRQPKPMKKGICFIAAPGSG